jgi:D-glycero-alpha-D-manno-heptose-7-phosphate kinase
MVHPMTSSEANDLSALLEGARVEGRVPALRGYHRIDGPGSSLDLREFQQALWVTPPAGYLTDPDAAAVWSRKAPRTVALTIDTGTLVQAHPFEPGAIAVESVEYTTIATGRPGSIPPTRENWLLKIVEAFGLSGVRFVLRNLVDGTRSSGLGGSATATTGVAMLANALAGSPLSKTQIVGMASRMETELGVSLTGTQEQSNVAFGGVVDYVWFPWGKPGEPGTGYGSSVRTTLVDTTDYHEVESRMSILHTGRERASSLTNAAWVEALSDTAGQMQLERKVESAYRYREGLRLRDWASVTTAIEDYRDARTTLCEDYMTGAAEMHRAARDSGGAVFPLGAGGGGGVLIFHEDPQQLARLTATLRDSFREIPVRLRGTGHDFENLPIAG